MGIGSAIHIVSKPQKAPLPSWEGRFVGFYGEYPRYLRRRQQQLGQIIGGNPGKQPAESGA